jgi:oxalate decarboxylase
MEVFRADRFEEVLLSDWLAHSPIDMVAETLNLDPSIIAQGGAAGSPRTM